MEVMTKGELIAKLQGMPCSDATPVHIFDIELSAHTDDGDGGCDGLYEFDVEYIDQWGDASEDEREYMLERYDRKPTPWIALTFDNPDLEQSHPALGIIDTRSDEPAIQNPYNSSGDTPYQGTPEQSDSKETLPTDKYKYCNHHHELTDQHEVVDFGDGEFVANKAAIPLLRALNELGFRTRTHHVDKNGGFVSIIISEHVRAEIKMINEVDAERTKYNGKTELLITW